MQSPISARALTMAGLSAMCCLVAYGPAVAADLAPMIPYDEPAYAVSPALDLDHWTGFYAGATVGFSGFGAASKETTVNGTKFSKFDIDEGAFLPGVHVGYNFAPFGVGSAGGWMVGVEGDIALAKIDVKKTDKVHGEAQLENGFLATARVRAGYAFERVYLYGTVGVAMTDIDVSPTAKLVLPAGKKKKKDGHDFHAGLVAGLGAELAINDNWSAKVEALALGLGEDDATFAGTKREFGIGGAAVRVGVSRRF